MLWIRTWFGNELTDASPDDPATTRTVADIAYQKLWRRVFSEDGMHVRYRDFLHLSFGLSANANVFQRGENAEIDRAIALLETNVNTAVRQHSASEDVVSVDQVPSFLLPILMDCPDLIDGMSDDDWRKHDVETKAKEEAYGLARDQRLLLMITDRKACEQGWVYLVAVNHKGEALPTRARVHAAKAQYYAVEWYNEGVPLSDMDLEGSEIVIYEQKGSGWDDW